MNATIVRLRSNRNYWLRNQNTQKEKEITELKSMNAEEVAGLTAEVEKLEGLLENVDKNVEVRRQEEALIKKINVAVSEMDQEINKATHESVVTLHAVYGEACTVHVSKRSKRNRNTINRKARAAAMAAASTIE